MRPNLGVWCPVRSSPSSWHTIDRSVFVTILYKSKSISQYKFTHQHTEIKKYQIKIDIKLILYCTWSWRFLCCVRRSAYAQRLTALEALSPADQFLPPALCSSQQASLKSRKSSRIYTSYSSDSIFASHFLRQAHFQQKNYLFQSFCSHFQPCVPVTWRVQSLPSRTERTSLVKKFHRVHIVSNKIYIKRKNLV